MILIGSQPENPSLILFPKGLGREVIGLLASVGGQSLSIWSLTLYISSISLILWCLLKCGSDFFCCWGASSKVVPRQPTKLCVFVCVSLGWAPLIEGLSRVLKPVMINNGLCRMLGNSDCGLDELLFGFPSLGSLFQVLWLILGILSGLQMASRRLEFLFSFLFCLFFAYSPFSNFYVLSLSNYSRVLFALFVLFSYILYRTIFGGHLLYWLYTPWGRKN